nr:maleylpyruvate isomerase N-terminal domain-containing protein [uncultured Mucilaginibacter sp.]
MIETRHLFPILHGKLIELLCSLSDEDWQKPTIAKLWTVKDIAAHLLDVNYRTIAFKRNYSVKPDREINCYEDLVGYLNHLNAEWVSAMKRIDPETLIEMLDETGKQHSDYMASLDPNDEAPFSVAWAGEERSTMWFHVAREYTEKWHHQQQIRDAVGKQGIMGRDLYYPCMDTFMFGLPHCYRNTNAPNGTIVKITITTDSGGDWYLIKGDTGWILSKTESGDVAASVILDPDTAWKLFTKGLTPDTAAKLVKLGGDIELAGVVLTMVAVMA